MYVVTQITGDTTEHEWVNKREKSERTPQRKTRWENMKETSHSEQGSAGEIVMKTSTKEESQDLEQATTILFSLMCRTEQSHTSGDSSSIDTISMFMLQYVDELRLLLFSKRSKFTKRVQCKRVTHPAFLTRSLSALFMAFMH